MKRSFPNKLAYASASFSAALLLQFFQSKAQFFYVSELKMSPTYYAVAIGIWAIYNAINDPAMGWIMDRKITRWGRRLPWMIAFWIPLVLSFALIWAPPLQFLTTEFLLFIYLLVVLILFDTGFTIVILAWAALFPEIYDETLDRNSVSALRQVFSLIALVIALVVPPLFVHDSNIPSYAAFGWVLAGISFVNLGIAFFGCKERHYSTIKEENKYSIKEGIQLLLGNRNYQVFLAANLIVYFAYGQVLAMLPFYRKFVLQLDELFETIAYGVAILTTLFALIFWIWFTNKYTPKYTFIWSSIVFSISLLPLWFLTTTNIIYMIFIILGFGLAGLLMVVDLMISDVIDADFVASGKRKEGIFFGFNGFFIRLAILMQAISLALVSAATGYDKNAAVQTPLAQIGIKIQMFLLPILAFIVAIYIVLKYYSLEGENLSRIKTALLELQ